MEHRFKMAAAEDEREGSASVLSRFTASRVRDAQIELTREGLRHTPLTADHILPCAPLSRLTKCNGIGGVSLISSSLPCWAGRRRTRRSRSGPSIYSCWVWSSSPSPGAGVMKNRPLTPKPSQGSPPGTGGGGQNREPASSGDPPASRLRVRELSQMMCLEGIESLPCDPELGEAEFPVAGRIPLRADPGRGRGLKLVPVAARIVGRCSYVTVARFQEI